LNDGLKELPESKKLLEYRELCLVEMKKERVRANEVSLINNVSEDKKMQLYRNIRGKGIKLGKKVHHLPEGIEIPVSVDKKGKLHFPVILVYDEFRQIDVVQDWVED
jgi:alpha-galactosidase/6-phospho-beta-glucosidase family protein